MDSRFIQFQNVQLGLKELGSNAPLMKDNLEARISDESLFGIYLDSKTIQLYGGVNEYQRHRFKIDHEFDLSLITNGTVVQDGAVHFDSSDVYLKSQGTEFIIISQSDIQGAEVNYAIRADKYTSIRAKLNKRTINISQLEKAGGFKVDSDLTTAEAKSSDGWLELMVGKNKATIKDYALAKTSIENYVDKAEKNNCFKSGRGMCFYVETDSNDYKARAWFVLNSDCRSIADGRSGLLNDGRFLRVSRSAAKGGDTQENKPITYTPNGILDHLSKNPITDARFAAALLGYANEFYNPKKQ